MDERTIVCPELPPAIDDLCRGGFRVELIYPADDPHTAVLSRNGEQVRLTSRPDAPPLPKSLPSFAAQLVLTRAGDAPSRGRAGMLYRDLIPGRLGGRYLASHIAIPHGGPVADWVHYHHVALHFLYVRSGWVRVVYEDQGDPFVMREGDLVLQPPEIRHRVLESSDGFEVIEVGAPALHATFADYDLQLPNGNDPARHFGGQSFLHHVAANTSWTPFAGAEVQETELDRATGGLADVRTVRAAGAERIDVAAHDGELVFGFVLDGCATLEGSNGGDLGPADAFVIPPAEAWSLSRLSPDFRLLHVTTARLD